MGSAGECPDANVGKMWEFPAGWGCVGVEFFPFVWIFYTVGGGASVDNDGAHVG